VSRVVRAALLILVGGAAGAVSAAAQAPAESTAQPADAPGVAPTFAGRLDEVNALSEAPARSATTVHLVLRRDAATFSLDGGTLSLLGPIGGRTVAAVYQGPGTFTYAPASRLEQRRLTRAYKSASLVAPLTAIVFVFSDSTLAELGRTLTFGAAAVLPGDVKGRVREMLSFVSDPDSKSPDPDVMGDLLNSASSDLFYAHVVRTSGDPVMFMLDPYAVEGSRLLGRTRRAGWTRMTQVVSQSRRVGDSAAAVSERRAQIDVTHYTLDVSIPRNNAGEVSFTAAARLDLAASVPVGPWVTFELFPKLKVDSARWADGTTAEVAKLKDASELWLRLDHPLATGETRPVTIYYHGDLIDRYDDLLYIKSSISWYPLTLEGRTKATFDLTFHTPPSYRFASVGERVDSATDANGLVRTRWVTATPIRNASFNLGVFETFTAQAAGLPPVVVLYSEQAHRSGLFPRAYAKERVGQDVLSALQFFQHVYGDVPVKQFYATEIPYDHGEAFPGLVHLALSTFVTSADDGFDEFFRAHEVAHQWWAIGVDYATYHDRWLSEGFASFSGLWYMQTARKQNKLYFSMLDRWRADIFLHRGEDESLAFGDRVGDATDAADYQTIVYEKGAWVLHMLRVLMLDMKTMNEDRFTSGMREFYASYRGERASTLDFRRVMERHAGADLGWFFDEWFEGASMPSYKVSWKAEPADGGKFRVRLRVLQADVPDDFVMYVPVTIALDGGGTARVRVKVQGPRTDLELPLMPSRPKDLKFNDLDGVLADVSTTGWSD
jgi:hypothetical protein